MCIISITGSLNFHLGINNYSSASFNVALIFDSQKPVPKKAKQEASASSLNKNSIQSQVFILIFSHVWMTEAADKTHTHKNNHCVYILAADIPPRNAFNWFPSSSLFTLFKWFINEWMVQIRGLAGFNFAGAEVEMKIKSGSDEACVLFYFTATFAAVYLHINILMSSCALNVMQNRHNKNHQLLFIWSGMSILWSYFIILFPFIMF